MVEFLGVRFITHPRQCPVEFHVKSAGHPIMAGITDFTFPQDEHYQMEVLSEELEVFAETSSAAGTFPAGLARELGGGRVKNLALPDVPVISESGVEKESVAAVGISNQRETSLIWDRNTGLPVADAVVWQCARAAELCELFGIAPAILPEVCMSDSNFGETDLDGFLPRPIPIRGVLGDAS